jgi:hypothetical protein
MISFAYVFSIPKLKNTVFELEPRLVECMKTPMKPPKRVPKPKKARKRKLGNEEVDLFFEHIPNSSK